MATINSWKIQQDINEGKQKKLIEEDENDNQGNIRSRRN
jgi:hypothetical protein